MLLCSFSFDMLHSIDDVVAAADDVKHPFSNDAGALVCFIEKAFAGTDPSHRLFAPLTIESDESFASLYRELIPTLKTGLGRMLFNDLATTVLREHSMPAEKRNQRLYMLHEMLTEATDKGPPVR